MALWGPKTADEGETAPFHSTYTAGAGKSGEDDAKTRRGQESEGEVVGRRFNWGGGELPDITTSGRAE